MWIFNTYAEYIMQNAALDESQAGIRTAGRNINNLRYADDIILMVEIKEELKSLLMKVKEESKKASLKLNIQKMKIIEDPAVVYVRECFAYVFFWEFNSFWAYVLIFNPF